ncbi:hypothetical protein BT67DRAFT_108757 [Trichocladium antarcticum]|uniref:Uncharacterized protein n=1 Tax=Trichocladium antarcticum TaxID=1450529 RepID=A0AAN6ZGW0_9PEZI|nr:hypothetical protein BT67DRAFT_108757 [Trichocladium antarcticum]
MWIGGWKGKAKRRQVSSNAAKPRNTWCCCCCGALALAIYLCILSISESLADRWSVDRRPTNPYTMMWNGANPIPRSSLEPQRLLLLLHVAGYIARGADPAQPTDGKLRAASLPATLAQGGRIYMDGYMHGVWHHPHSRDLLACHDPPPGSAQCSGCRWPDRAGGLCLKQAGGRRFMFQRPSVLAGELPCQWGRRVGQGAALGCRDSGGAEAVRDRRVKIPGVVAVAG